MNPRSPLPWKRQLLPDGQYEFQDANGVQVFADEVLPTNDVMFILHACNSHPKAIAKLKTCTKFLIEQGHNGNSPALRLAVDCLDLLKDMGELE